MKPDDIPLFSTRAVHILIDIHNQNKSIYSESPLLQLRLIGGLKTIFSNEFRSKHKGKVVPILLQDNTRFFPDKNGRADEKYPFHSMALVAIYTQNSDGKINIKLIHLDSINFSHPRVELQNLLQEGDHLFTNSSIHSWDSRQVPETGCTIFALRDLKYITKAIAENNYIDTLDSLQNHESSKVTVIKHTDLPLPVQQMSHHTQHRHTKSTIAPHKESKLDQFPPKFQYSSNDFYGLKYTSLICEQLAENAPPPTTLLRRLANCFSFSRL